MLDVLSTFLMKKPIRNNFINIFFLKLRHTHLDVLHSKNTTRIIFIIMKFYFNVNLKAAERRLT